MKYSCLFLSRRSPVLFLGFVLGASVYGENPSAPTGKTGAGPLFTWSFLWAGSWEEEKTLYNRGDLRLTAPGPGLTLRAGAIDRRLPDIGLFSPGKDAGNSVTHYGAGLYHKPSGSRLLYGVLDEWGLPARLRNPWIRGLPLAENHNPSIADLKTAVSAAGKPETYFYLGSPRLNLPPRGPDSGIKVRGFASAQIDQDMNPGFGGGLETRFGGKTEARLDGFYTEKILPPRKSSSWFSESPPLPGREFRLYGLGLLLNIPILTVSSDWALSETFAGGRDVYGNLGLRITRPLPADWGRWALSLAADGVGSRYTGRDGSSPGAGFRTGGKLEWQGKRIGLFRLNTTLRSSGLEEPFNRSSSGISWRLPAPGKNSAGLFRLTRISLGTDRNALDPQNILDSLNLAAGFSLNLRNFFGSAPGGGKARSLLSFPVGISFSGSLKGAAAGEEPPPPYPVPPYSCRFDSAKAAGELSWSPGIFQLKAKAGYGIKNEKEGIWETAFSTAVRFKPGRLSVKISSPDFPDQWTYTVSWRVEKK
ncbi:MAG: hypothetical protein LBK27_01740 [Treponema sp.]|jgi:hypothetical protein|nr:hypothetical protein [Treponema sp.]